MSIYNGAALEEAFRLLKIEIHICRISIAGICVNVDRKYYQSRLNTLENIQGWLKAHS